MEVTLSDGTRMQCDDRSFNQGAEGALYWADGKNYVVKLYLQHDPHRRQTIENIVNKFNLVKDDPARQPYFGWPDAIVVAPTLGIRMPTVKDAKPLDNYVRPAFWKTLPPAERGSWHMRVSITFRMARILRWMHQRGLCHSDLSPKNFLVNANTGQTTLIDCDGLVVPGIQPPSVLGTPQCMAPEIVMGKAMPTVNTDKHALAVLIYWAFLLRHPLQGPKVHHPVPEEDERLAYGAKALYIEHPTDSSNRPASLPFTSELLTPLVRNLFHKAFVDGLHDPSKRPSAAQWEAALVRMADRVVPCQNPACPMKAYVVPDSHNFKCPWCGTPYKSPAGLLPVIYLYRTGARRGAYTSDDWSVAGLPNRRLWMHHADGRKSPDPGAPTAAVAHLETDGKNKWYLVNEGLDDANVLETTGAIPFKRGDRVELVPGIKIVMGREESYRVGYVQMIHTL